MTSRNTNALKPTPVTNVVPRRRSVNQHPAPEFSEAVTVSRFWRNVSIGDEEACWPWTGDVDKNGYGLFSYHGRHRPAHELAFSFTTGEKRAANLVTCHSCDNLPCCNPAHLRFDTQRENVADMDARSRRRSTVKLTEVDIRAIRERRSCGARQKDLAEQYGVTDGQISMIVRGIRWRNAGGPIERERKYCRG